MKRPENVSFTKYLEANSSLEREEIIKSTYRYINELEKALNMRIVSKSFNADLKVGDKVLKSGVFPARIIEELKPNVFKIQYPDGYEMLARTQDLELATDSI